MSRITSILSLLTGSALSAVPVDFRMPVRFGYDSIHANVTVTTSSGSRIIEAKFTHGDMYLLATDAIEMEPATLSFASSSHPGRVFDFRAEEPMYVRQPASSYIAIGASSDLVQRVGSVALIKGTDNRGELIFGASLDQFNRNCAPGTLMGLNISSGSVQVDAKLVNGTNSESFGDRGLEIDGPRSFRTTVPRAMFTRIEELLIARGSARVPGIIAAKFTGCSEAIVASLPNIELTTGVGSIVYFPEDYAVFNASDNTCSLRLVAARDGESLKFSPFLLVDTNVRVTRNNEWQICESAAVF
jgi:hypothetical protein